MTGTGTNSITPSLLEGVQAVWRAPDAAGRKQKANRLVISDGPLGSQLMMLPSLEKAEEDPNP